MKNNTKLFKNRHPIIGALHFMPLPGFDGFTTMDVVLKNAIKDLNALDKGGVDGIIVENNYDIPHKIYVDPETIAAMTYLTLEISKRTKLPIGISVLWNDYKVAFSIAKVTGAKFIRIPAFVDSVKTSYGNVYAVAKDALLYRERIKADEILIFADVQVKHSEMINKTKKLGESVKEAYDMGADAIIITGKWTGNAPDFADLVEVKKMALNIPIIIGSGVDEDNILDLKQYADGFIVGTSLKKGNNFSKIKEVNIKSYDQRIDLIKVKKIVSIR